MYVSGYIGKLEEIPKSISSLCGYTSQFLTLAACQIYYYSVLQYMSVYITSCLNSLHFSTNLCTCYIDIITA